MKVWKVIPIFLILVLNISAQGLSTYQLPYIVQQSFDIFVDVEHLSSDSSPNSVQQSSDILAYAELKSSDSLVNAELQLSVTFPDVEQHSVDLLADAEQQSVDILTIEEQERADSLPNKINQVVDSLPVKIQQIQQSVDSLINTKPQIVDSLINAKPQIIDSLSNMIKQAVEPLPNNEQGLGESLPARRKQSQPILIENDSIIVLKDADTVAITGEFKPNPKKAILFAAIFPGLGQVYNRKYWKLPIIYGGFIGFTYAITWNNRYYQDYSQGYKDIMDDDPITDSWTNFLRYGQDPESVDKVWLKDVLKRRKDYYRRYRDLSIIGTIALYGLGIVDAYVDAQLFDFDISQDLSMKVEPVVIQKNNYYLADSFGVRCSINF